MRKLIKETGISMIQWRNFNIDPDWYLELIGVERDLPKLGIKNVMKLLKSEFPTIAYGYFNPPLEVMKKYIKSEEVLSGR
jgi:hypothetical protein